MKTLKEFTFNDMMAVKDIEGEDEMLAYQRKKRKGGTTGGNNAEYEQVDKDVDEALTPAERSKRAMAMKRIASKLKMARKKAEKRMADDKTIMKRAEKAARKAIEDKILKDKSKDELSYGARSSLEKQVDKKKGAIKKMAKKLFQKLKKAEKAKFSKSDSVDSE